MRVCTYPDPFYINENTALWELLTKNPHFCASDTLVQGLTRKYRRESFGHLRSIATLVDGIYKEWTRNIQKDVKLHLKISEYIDALPEDTVAVQARKRALKFNKYEIVKAVNVLLILDSKDEDFNPAALSYEQNVVLDIYKQLKKDDLTKGLRDCGTLTKEQFSEAILNTILDELAFSFGKKDCPKTIAEAKVFLVERLKQLEKKAEEPLGFGEDDDFVKSGIDKIKHYLNIIDSHKTFDKVVVHGIHKISPIMYRLFNAMTAAGIEVIFVFNYMENYPSICDTWKKVYAWTGCEFEFVRPHTAFDGLIGKSFIDALEGFEAGKHVDQDIIKYPNLTEFTDEISACYSEAHRKDKDNPLQKMKTQYYAVDGESSNKILKIYYPQQFADKHFLSYPIGQFILHLYDMWDDEKKCIKIDFSKLMECINAGLFERANMARLYRICSDLNIFFQDVEDMTDFVLRIAELKKNKALVEKDSRFGILKYLSFYNVGMADIDLFAKFVSEINQFAVGVFNQKKPKYKEHFSSLIEKIKVLSRTGITEKEKTLIDEISERLSEGHDDEIEGSVENIKESIHYYLASVSDSDSSNWIVRDFDQIDGGILLSEKNKCEFYHFALLSDNHMCSKKMQDLPFPLTLNMFACSADPSSGVSVYYNTLNERRNYLKFYLFYGLIFCKKKFKLSFIEKEEDEQQEAYYVLKLLRVNEVKPPPIENSRIRVDADIVPQTPRILHVPNDDAQEMYSVCAFKYFLNECLKTKIVYKADYNLKYFVKNFLVYFMQKQYKGNPWAEFADSMKTNSDLLLIRKLFPFWLDIEYEDIKRDFERDLGRSDIIPEITARDERHWRRKRNFLNAQWKDNSGRRTIDFNFREDLWRKYMNSDELHEFAEYRTPHEKVCSNCNYSELCLRSYYEVHDGTDDIGDIRDEQE